MYENKHGNRVYAKLIDAVCWFSVESYMVVDVVLIVIMLIVFYVEGMV